MSLEELIERSVERAVERALRRMREEPAVPAELLTISEAAQLAKVEPSTIRAWMKRGLTKYGTARSPRVRRDQLLTFKQVPDEEAGIEELAARLLGRK
jgi:DNA-directed RNA polymerase specialized sigma24 family protein